MKTRELLYIVLAAVGAFILSEYIVYHLNTFDAFRRMILRIGFQIQYFALIFLLFEFRDIVRRVKALESEISGSRLTGGPDHARQEHESRKGPTNDTEPGT